MNSLSEARAEILTIWHCDKPFLFMCALAAVNAYICGVIIGIFTA